MRLRQWIGIILLIIIGYGLYRGGSFVLFALSPANTEYPSKMALLIPKGSTGSKVADILEENLIISSKRRFLAVGKILGYWKKIKVGEYLVSSEQTPLEIFGILTSGKSIQHSMTIQEGKNMYQIAEFVEKMSFATKAEILELTRDQSFIASLGFNPPLPETLEGYLFPDTYLFNRTNTPKEIVKTMVNRFFKEWTPERQRQAKKIKLSMHEVVTLASVIEKETGAAHERKIISSVFHNRLKKRMRLQSDPTTIYGIWETFNGNLRRKHLKQKTPFNTYTIYGLPKGPIANPGVHSIDAAMNPNHTKYLYFVSRNDGTHEFTTNLKAHLNAVRKFQLNRKARQGKSWRDLNKKKQ